MEYPGHAVIGQIMKMHFACLPSQIHKGWLQVE
jgi:hypothetical protein